MADESTTPKEMETPAEVSPDAQPAKPGKTKGKGKPAQGKAASAAPATNRSRRTPAPVWTFPKHTLEEAIRVAQAIYEKHGGNPVDAERLASFVGFNKVADWRFQDLLKAANLYGLVQGSGERATIRLERIGEDILTPSSPSERQAALLKAFNNVDVFKRVTEFYAKDRALPERLPEDEYFGNTLVKDFDIQRDRVDTFIRVFTDNLKYLKSFGVARGQAVVQTNGKPVIEERKHTEEEEAGGREFIDTCFVLMPFGDWYDRYYEDIYYPAIRESGLEPRRADSVFHSGSVMEHIWEEIQKSKVLVADLTGKNPNVFYELGLAHASGKPVVFVTGNLEDVPFDLRHLRVIEYDIRDPWWGDKLKKGITEYVKNAKKDPTKSIPQPFRDSAALETASSAAS